MPDSTSHVDRPYTLGLSDQFECDRSISHIHDVVDVHALSVVQIYMHIMSVHVRVHALVSLAASVAWPDRLADHVEPCSAPVPSQHFGSRKADMKTLFFFFPTPYPCHVRAQEAMKPRHHGQQSCLCPAIIYFIP